MTLEQLQQLLSMKPGQTMDLPGEIEVDSLADFTITASAVKITRNAEVPTDAEAERRALGSGATRR